jgi:hypothetical protein
MLYYFIANLVGKKLASGEVKITVFDYRNGIGIIP